jgi:hypothetical protein
MRNSVEQAIGFLQNLMTELDEPVECAEPEPEVDLEETYYQVEYVFREQGYEVDRLDHALDENEESAEEFLTRASEGEDIIQLAYEYEFIED